MSSDVATPPESVRKALLRPPVVAFSAEQVYAIAELLRRQRGGAAVVMGALSPRTRNAQVALFQSGEGDFLVATDAIGMGLPWWEPGGGENHPDAILYMQNIELDGQRIVEDGAIVGP